MDRHCVQKTTHLTLLHTRRHDCTTRSICSFLLTFFVCRVTFVFWTTLLQRFGLREKCAQCEAMQCARPAHGDTQAPHRAPRPRLHPAPRPSLARAVRALFLPHIPSHRRVSLVRGVDASCCARSDAAHGAAGAAGPSHHGARPLLSDSW
mgnify:CR=1 FL=1